MSFRFEKNQNVITKHHLDKKLSWSQAAKMAFNLNANKYTVCSVKQTNPHTVEIIRRNNKQKLGLSYRLFGTDQLGSYERVTINREKKTVAIDRLDVNWWHEAPFLGRRDFFYVENREGSNSQNGALTFVQHDYWVFFTDVAWT